jgi:hypothetical protein
MIPQSSLVFSNTYFSLDIPDCDMKDLFPTIAHDSDSGAVQQYLQQKYALLLRIILRDRTKIPRLKGYMDTRGYRSPRIGTLLKSLHQ